MDKIDYKFLKDNDLIIFEAIVGSTSYGTNTPESDIDKKFVYILPEDFILGNHYKQQIDVNDDYTGWEIKRFLELLGTANPTVMELLYSPEDCIVYKHSIFDELIKNRDKFITKQCKNSFGGYARQQIIKAKGLNKKQNWEKDKVKRKDVLDFCNIITGNKSIPLKKWLKLYSDFSDSQKFFGVSKVPNARDVYSLFFDDNAADIYSKDVTKEESKKIELEILENGEKLSLGYKGIVKEGDSDNYSISNQLRLSSIPKGEKPVALMSYNKDAYTQHCRDYKDYQKWLEKRNEQRYVDTKKHGQQIDGKNMLHCVRLTRMSKEIAEGKGLIIRRPDAEYLLSIRRGEVDLESLIESTNKIIEEMDNLFEKSNLPEKVESKLIYELLLNIRKEFYKK
jgi:predicted nucleotidyltransferase